MNKKQKRLRIELLVASPPTSLCRQLITQMTSLLDEFPDQLRLDLYYAGEAMSVIPTEGYQRDPNGKRRRIPSAYINGKKVASQEVPDPELIRKATEEELLKNPGEWQK